MTEIVATTVVACALWTAMLLLGLILPPILQYGSYFSKTESSKALVFAHGPLWHKHIVAANFINFLFFSFVIVFSLLSLFLMGKLLKDMISVFLIFGFKTLFLTRSWGDGKQKAVIELSNCSHICVLINL